MAEITIDIDPEDVLDSLSKKQKDRIIMDWAKDFFWDHSVNSILVMLEVTEDEIESFINDEFKKRGFDKNGD